MRKILLLGAGRSSTALINYLLERSVNENWLLKVGDVSVQQAHEKTKGHPHAIPFMFDVQNMDQLNDEVSAADIVISLLPPHLHIKVAHSCVKNRKSLVTASYVSSEIEALHSGAVEAGVLLLNETGLDPGIDHMSAMEIFDKLKQEGCEITSFKSYTGGLVAHESDNNPWHYKISWNPRNVVLAGQGGAARYYEEGCIKLVPYHKLFSRTEEIRINDEVFEGYANRDSLKYKEIYKLENVSTLIRGTLRKSPFCKAWNLLVQLGYTDDSFEIPISRSTTYSDFTSSFLPLSEGSSKQRLIDYLKPEKELLEMIDWLGLLSDKKIAIEKKMASPAFILQLALEHKWMLLPDDRDRVVMVHRVEFRKNDKKCELESCLSLNGENSANTAMASTVGLPLAIAAENILNKKINVLGVQIPVSKEIYRPLLESLKCHGIVFTEKTIELQN